MSFQENDPKQPNNWSQVRIRCYSTYSSEGYKVFEIEKESICGLCVVINSTMSSSLTACATRPLSSHFHVTDQENLVLRTSVFLAGYTFGLLLF